MSIVIRHIDYEHIAASPLTVTLRCSKDEHRVKYVLSAMVNACLWIHRRDWVRDQIEGGWRKALYAMAIAGCDEAADELYGDIKDRHEQQAESPTRRTA